MLVDDDVCLPHRSESPLIEQNVSLVDRKRILSLLRSSKLLMILCVNSCAPLFSVHLLSPGVDVVGSPEGHS